MKSLLRNLVSGLLLMFALSIAAFGQAVPADDWSVQLTTTKAETDDHLHVNWNQNASGTVNSSDQSYLRFDMSMFPSNLTGASIQKATLILYVEQGNVSGAGHVTICQLGQAWSSTTMTGLNAPTCLPGIAPIAFAVTGSQITNGSFLTVDVTPIVQNWFNGQTNYGIGLIAEAPITGTGNGINVKFDSIRDTGNGYPAQLDLVLQNSGPIGPQGPAGVAGPAGPAGQNGAAGAQGPQGLPGVSGAQGPIGLTGPAGVAGAQGLQGPQGLTGAVGPTGQTGAVGPQGLQGIAGTNGTNGTNGTGFNFRNAFDPTATYAVNDVVTFNGSSYTATAASGPNPQTPDLNTSAWGILAQVGAVGPAGANGNDGAVGPMGPIGLIGPQGAQGSQGLTGATGAQGPQGLTGATGAAGPQGIQGFDGVAGVAGPSGPTGPAGPAGTNGFGGTWSPNGSYSIGQGVMRPNVGGTKGPFFNLTGNVGTDPAADTVNWIYCCGTPTVGYAAFAISGTLPTALGAGATANLETYTFNAADYMTLAGLTISNLSGTITTVTGVTTTCDGFALSGAWYNPVQWDGSVPACYPNYFGTTTTPTNCSVIQQMGTRFVSGQGTVPIFRYSCSTGTSTNGPTGNLTFTVVKNGVVTTMQMSEASGSLNSPTGTVAFNAGDTITIQVTNPQSSAVTSLNGSWSIH
jgi:collagen triple helix repeat protein